MDLLTAFILGLVGSLHCAGMCGPLALALPHPGGSATRFFASRFAYNLGRVITYIFIGICFGSLGRSLVLAGLQCWTSISLGALLLFALIFSRKLRLLALLSLLVERLKQHMSALLRRRSLLRCSHPGAFKWPTALRPGLRCSNWSSGDGFNSGRCRLHGCIRRRNRPDNADD